MKKSDIFNHFTPFSPTFFYFLLKNRLKWSWGSIKLPYTAVKCGIFSVRKWEIGLFFP
jgi:hypothetical protein